MSMPVTYEGIMLDLMNNGPASVGFIVYTDFLSYESGIYEYTYGDVEAAHAVKLIGWGYDGNDRLYWTCQNQWGDWWGESGYFRIYAGQAGIDSASFACKPDV